MPGNKNPKTRKQQSEATHRLLLENARKALKKRGFAATTIREVAESAGVATGTVMAHFGSKEEMLYEVLHHDINNIAEVVFASAKPDLPVCKSLQFIGESFLKEYASEPDLYANFLEHSLFARGTWGDRFTEQVEQVGGQVAAILSAAVQRKELHTNTDIRAATMTFFANYYFVLIIQIKCRFADVDAGVTQLRMLVEHQIEGLKR
ncbi:MAG TPA: hypothetical protein DDW52_18490 [Planctomycetaceae bacterium]|nr:hypothetical protein [Planctomycetaceae bacterium]